MDDNFASGCISRRFDRSEFNRLFRNAIDACRRAALNYCTESLPDGELFYIGDGQFAWDERTRVITVHLDELLDFEAAGRALLREDGMHRPDIRISPLGTFDLHAVFELEWDGNWTDRLIVGELSFPYEPFLIRGPAIPPEYDVHDGAPLPKIPLPAIRVAPSSTTT